MDPNKVVATHGCWSWTWQELRDLFNRVAPKGNWKLPIDTVVDVANDREKHGIREAVIFFTASVPDFEPVLGGVLPGCRYRITAAGYYAVIGP